MEYTDDKNKFAHSIQHTEKALEAGASVTEKDEGHYLANAAQAVDQQKRQNFKDAFTMYKPAIMWSVIMSTAIIMEGYDTLLLGQFYAQPAFARRFGSYSEAGGRYQISPAWQTGLSCATSIGNIFGLQITGWGCERYGYKKTMIFAIICLTGFLFIQFFAVNLPMLLVGYILLGFPWGTFQTLSVSYASEVMPVRLRQYLTTYVNLCWVIGQIICSGVNKALIDNTTEWAYKIPFAIQWVWTIPLIIGITFCPESPYWLTRVGRFEDAERSMMKLTSRDSGFTEDEAKKQVAMMHHTNELEKAQTSGVQFWDCFRGTNLRRTEIACLVWLGQQTCGSGLMGQATYFFQTAGLSDSAASTLNLCMFAVGACGTIGSWFLMQPFGRRTIYLYGQIALALIMLITGILGTLKQTESTGWAIGALLICFTGLYDLTVGPICYSLVAEMSSTRLRTKTVILARNLYNIGGIVINVINPRVLNTESNVYLGPKSAFIWLILGCFMIAWVFWRLPEPKGRTFGELDILFERKVSARKFSKTEVDEFEAAERDKAEGASGAAMVH